MEPLVQEGAGFGRTALLHYQMAALVSRMDAMQKSMERMHLELPKQIAKVSAASAVAAVRSYDEDEAMSVRMADEAMGLRDIHRAIRHISRFSQLGTIEGFSVYAAENLLQCDVCVRYASFAPGALTRGAKDPGIIRGPDLQRPLSIVKFKAKTHVACSMHNWCVVHADEVSCAPPPPSGARAPPPPSGAHRPRLVVRAPPQCVCVYVYVLSR